MNARAVQGSRSSGRAAAATWSPSMSNTGDGRGMMSESIESRSRPASAIRVDDRLGIRETAEFFRSGGMEIFGCRHEPVGVAVGGLVVCPPILAELPRTYRAEVLLG